MATRTRKSSTRTTPRGAELQAEALSRAVGNLSIANYGPIIEGFMARGIPADSITPRENVFTYHAWRALGRQVRKGEKGVRVTTFVPLAGKGKGSGAELGEDSKDAGKRRPGGMRPRTAYVFHVTQTDPI